MSLVSEISSLAERVALQFNLRRMRTAIINVGETPVLLKTVTVTDADILPTDTIQVFQAAMPETAENSGERLEIQSATGNGNFTVTISNALQRQAIRGTFAINYFVR